MRCGAHPLHLLLAADPVVVAQRRVGLRETPWRGGGGGRRRDMKEREGEEAEKEEKKRVGGEGRLE